MMMMMMMMMMTMMRQVSNKSHYESLIKEID